MEYRFNWRTYCHCMADLYYSNRRARYHSLFCCQSAVDCGQYHSVAYGDIEVGLTTFTNQAIIQCDEGYVSSEGNQTAVSVCLGDGDWSPADITCTGTVSNQIEALSTLLQCKLYQNVFQYEGRKASSNSTKWYRLYWYYYIIMLVKVNTCTSVKLKYFFIVILAITCVTPPSIIHGFISSSKDLTYMSTLTYSCIHGYWFSRGVWSLMTSCTAKGSWEPALLHARCGGRLSFWGQFMAGCTLFKCVIHLFSYISLHPIAQWNATHITEVCHHCCGT